jgi:hypothetical protein
MKNKTRFGLNEYRRPTPIKLRKLGDALLIASTTLGAVEIHNPAVATGIIVIGTIGKFLTNFFSEQ